ncbi:hypothetical protein N9000_00110 [bacterium]|nr:hypothetical protein [bacterium]
MTINKTDLANTSTFGTWKTRTNELLAFARKTVSLGDSAEANNGNIVLNGNLSLGGSNPATDTITVNNISKCSTGDLKITNAATVQGVLTLDSGSGSASSIQFSNGDTPTWDISTQDDHSYLEIGDGDSYIRFQADGSGGKEIDGEGIRINNGILPTQISAVKFTSTGTGASRSVFAEANIGAGSITATTITCLGTGANNTTLSEVDINGGAIDGTAIGGVTPSTAAFSTVSASGLITANGGVTGDVTGNVTGNASGTAGGLTDEAIIEVLKAVYPLGSLFTSTANVDPGTARSPIFGTGGLGFGTWERYAEGRTLVGVDAEGSIGVVAGHTSEKSVFNDVAGRGRSAVFYLTTFDHGLDVGDRIDVNVGDNVTMDAYSSPSSPSDAFNPFAYTDTNGRGLEIIALGGSSGTIGTGVASGVPFVRVSIEDIYTNDMTAGQQADYDAIVAFKNFQVGGVDLTASNGMTIRNSRFRNGLAKGGTSHVKLDPKHVPDHVHIMKSPLTDIEYYGINDDNEDPAVRLKSGQSFGPTHNSLQYTTQNRATEHLAQFGNEASDGQFNRHTGLVRNYNGSQIVDIDVDKGHENMPPYEVVYIYRRIA